MFKKNFLKKIVGAFGERKAAKYLIKKGYRIVERNVNTPFGEVDIIASVGTVLVFVEVKTRSSEQYGAGIEAVTINKQKKLIKSAQYYCKMKNITPLCRFDVIAIDINHFGIRAIKNITHLENAFICYSSYK